MALKSTVFKAKLNVADTDRHYYAEHAVTLARHPSETDERMMVRLLAFAMFADERLEFGKGLSSTEEPALWNRDYAGVIKLWIEVGLPDERVLKKAAGRAERVVVLAYGGRAADIWWGKESPGLARLENLIVLAVEPEASAALANLVERGMDLQCTIQDGHIWITDGPETVLIEPRVLKGS
ncbi:MAG TPA: YaeQ family protein [Rhodocyclaceae bacterium]|nr:YaeQ family protein [Rhodocyclaceae bacterium]